MSKADGSLTFSMNVDNSKAVKKLNELEKKIADVEKEIEEKQTNRNAIAEQMETAKAKAEVARQKIALLNDELKKVKETPVEGWGYQKITNQDKLAEEQKDITAEIERQNALMQEEANRASKLAGELEKADRALSGPTKKLDKMQRKAGELTEKITMSRSATARLKEATAEADKRMEMLNKS